jgi:hypothetical protein
MLLRKTSSIRRRASNESGGGGSGMIPLNNLENYSNDLANNSNRNNSNHNIREANEKSTNNAPAPSTLLNSVQQQQLQQQFDDALNTPINLEWINKPWVQRIVRICALCSFVSICANTPTTFKNYKHIYIHLLTYFSDLITTMVLAIEMIAKIKIKSLFKGDTAYIFDRWCQFDGSMVIFNVISVILQVNNIKVFYS